MLAYATKLTVSIAEVQQEDICRLREHQFSDQAILEMNQIAGYFAYVNRLASGLGVDLEDFWQREPSSTAVAD
jgi:alkylhydroperoxidase family enzyme